MRKLVVGAVLGLALFVPCAASAQLFIGARLGYSIAGGDLYKDYSITKRTQGMVPVQVDLGLDVAKAFALGVYGSAGYTVIAKDFKTFCDTYGTDCSGMNVRLGAQATLHAPVGQSKIWGGVLLGWEQQQYKISGNGGSLEANYRGVEAGLQGGLDFPTSGAFRWGPFVSASAGEFQSASLSATGSGAGLAPITEKARHTWLSVGLRGVFGL